MTTAFPLAWPEGWPRTPAARRYHPRFGVSFDQGRRDLYREIEKLGAKSCVVSCNLGLRIDGQPRSDDALRNIPDPGVAVYFQMRERSMVIAQDRYLTVAENMRGIYLALSHLRHLERHGGAHMMERAFGGFARLPPPANGAAEAPPWREVFRVATAGFAVLSAGDLRAIVEQRYRDEAKANHADHERMIIINAAIAAAREELAS
jgi:hypothetical protein